MKLVRSIALLALSSVPMACRSSAPHHEVPCICGQPAADIEGCAHASCLKGKRNPENPDCVCGAMSIPK